MLGGGLRKEMEITREESNLYLSPKTRKLWDVLCHKEGHYKQDSPMRKRKEF